jgi:hypothetical protein
MDDRADAARESRDAPAHAVDAWSPSQSAARPAQDAERDPSTVLGQHAAIAKRLLGYTMKRVRNLKRASAFAACAAGRWQACEDGLDRAGRM